MKDFTVLDFMKWQQRNNGNNLNREDLSTYGVEQINSLINYFETLVSVEERDKILNEFPSFKTIMDSLKTLGLYEAYCHIVANSPSRI